MIDCNNARQAAVLGEVVVRAAFGRGHGERSMNSGFWKTDWFLGLAVVVALVIFNRYSDLIPSLDA